MAHVRTVHFQVFRFECPKCHFKSDRRPALIEHLLKIHQEEPNQVEEMIQSKSRMFNRAAGAEHHCNQCDYRYVGDVYLF